MTLFRKRSGPKKNKKKNPYFSHLHHAPQSAASLALHPHPFRVRIFQPSQSQRSPRVQHHLFTPGCQVCVPPTITTQHHFHLSAILFCRPRLSPASSCLFHECKSRRHYMAYGARCQIFRCLHFGCASGPIIMALFPPKSQVGQIWSALTRH